MIYSVGGDLFNQCAQRRPRSSARAERLEFIVVHDHFITPTARYADIVLPATTFWERNDVPHAVGGRRPLRDLHAAGDRADVRVPQRHRHLRRPGAPRSASSGYNDKTEERVAARAARATRSTTSTPSGAGAGAPARARTTPWRSPGEIRDPSTTRSRRRRGRSRSTRWRIAANPDPYGLGAISPIPTWIPDRWSRTRIRCGCVTPKSRARTHSIHGNQPILSRADRDDVWMHPGRRRGARHRRRRSVRCACSTSAAPTVLPAGVTDRIAPRLRLSIRKAPGSRPTRTARTAHGCANVLTGDRASPAAAAAFNSTFVEIAPGLARSSVGVASAGSR